MGRQPGSKLSDEARRNLSKAMRKAHAKKCLARAKERQQQTVVLDGFESAPVHVYKEPANAVETRFPFQQYEATVKEATTIVHNRDQAGRNAHLEFWDGFPHGLSDITFETHRRVARILGAERQMANGFAHKADELKQVMRNDLLDLANYALFGVMKLDKDGESYPS